MDGFIILFFLFVFFQIFKAATKSSKAKSGTLQAFKTAASKREEFGELKSRLENMSGQNTAQSNTPWGRDGPTARGRERLQKRGQLPPPSQASGKVSSGTQAKRQRAFEARREDARRAKERRRREAQHDHHDTIVETRDMHDKNRKRRADWGERAGPGLLNSKTVLALLVLGGIGLYVLSKISTGI